jgi:predicted negative regulator of RcsB-dependent stress response
MAPGKKISRKELLKSEDEFLTFSGRTMLYVRDHAKPFKYAGAAVVALLVVYLGVYGYLGHVERKGQSAYNEAYYALEKSRSSNKGPEKLQSVQDSFRNVIDQYSRSEAGKLARPELAHLKFMDKKYEEAVPLYLQFMEKTDGDSPYRSFAMLALAGCYEEMGENDKALEMLKRITSNPEGPAAELASLNLSRVYRLTGQNEKSRETLKEFEAKYKDSPFLPLVQAHIAKDLS